MAHTVRLAGVSYVPPPHDHRANGVNLKALRKVVSACRGQTGFHLLSGDLCLADWGWPNGVKSAPIWSRSLPRSASSPRSQRGFDRAVARTVFGPGLQLRSDRGSLRQTGHGLSREYPTIGEMDAGVTPGWEIPVAECDGVRVGRRSVSTPIFRQLPAELERSGHALCSGRRCSGAANSCSTGPYDTASTWLSPIRRKARSSI